MRINEVYCLVKKENVALFIAEKSDNTKTIFIVRRGFRAPEDKWSYPFCPSEMEWECYAKEFYNIYKIIDEENKLNRNRN